MNFGIQFSAKVHIISDELDQEAAADIDLGTNTLPTKERVDRLVKEAIEYANNALGVEDFRLLSLEDHGIACPSELRWEVE